MVLGEFTMSDIKRAPRGETRIKVFFDLDADGTLKVSARDMDTSQQQSITVSAYSYLTDTEIQGMIEDNREYALEQEYDEMLNRVRTNVESMIYYIETVLPALEGQFDANDKSRAALGKIHSVVDNAKSALENNDVERMVELETYLKKTRDILKSSSP